MLLFNAIVIIIFDWLPLSSSSLSLFLCYQDKEANLDILMDRMRQDATEEALKDSLGKSLQMLDGIKQG